MKLAAIFHHTVAQLLFLCQRARRYIQTPVSFLKKRVKTRTRVIGTNLCDVYNIEDYFTHETYPGGG